MPANNFPVVGVGASAGAVEALEGFFRGMPQAPGLAFVIVTHLSPDRESPASGNHRAIYVVAGARHYRWHADRSR
ncbi:chemotaxis protein CheB [Paraburkholderia sp. RL17-368-BIF-A]|uniref:chemotaxis protein CheB n=1 Tax=Paraburkholderia sp. RL17-368-BIF-A TaxID=3031628 RepID=UPI0038CD7860